MTEELAPLIPYYKQQLIDLNNLGERERE